MLIRKILKKAAVIGLCAATVLSSIPVYAEPEANQTGEVATYTLALVVRKDGLEITLPESEYEYDGTDHRFTSGNINDTTHRISIKAAGTSRDISRADFVVYYATGDTETAAYNSQLWSTEVPTIKHVRESKWVKVKIVDRNGVFEDVECEPVYFEVTPRDLFIAVKDEVKNWGDPDPVFSTPVITGLCDGDTINPVVSRTRAGEEPGDYPLTCTKGVTEADEAFYDYYFTIDNGILTIERGDLLEILDDIDLSDCDAEYDKRPHGIDTSALVIGTVPGTFKKVKYSVDGRTWTENNPTVTDANVSSKGVGTGESVYIKVKGQNDAEMTFGPYYIKVRRIPARLYIANGSIAWELSMHDNQPPTSRDIKDEYVIEPDSLVGSDRIVYDVACNPAPAGGFITGHRYEGYIHFSNVAVMAGNTDNSANYELTVEDGDFIPSNSAFDALNNNFSATGYTGTYDTKSHYARVSGYEDVGGTGLDAVVTYSSDGGNTWQRYYPEVIYAKDVSDSGRYIVRATLDGCAPVERNIEMEIEKATASIVAQPAQKKHGQTDPVFIAIAQGFMDATPVSGTDYTVYRDMANDPLGDAEKAGVHTGVIKVNIAKNWNNYTVSAKNADFTITSSASEKLANFSVTGYSGTYDGLEHTVSYKNASTATISYSTDGGVSWLDSAPMFKDTTLTDDGLYVEAKQVIVRATIDGEHVDKTTTVKIARKTAYIRANAVTKSEDEQDPVFTASVTGLVGRESFNYEVIRTDIGDETVGVHKGVLVPELLEEYPNYSIHLVNAALTITRGQSYTDIQSFDVSGWEGPYDGSEHSVTIKKSVQGADITYSTDGSSYSSSKPGIKNVKDSTSVWVKCSKGGYEKIVKTNVTVKRKQAAIQVNNATKVQGESMPSFSAETSGTVNGETFDYSLSCSVSDTVGTHSGAIKCTLSGEYPNYTITIKNGTLTITKAETQTPEPTPTPTPTPEPTPTPTDPKRKGDTTKDDGDPGKKPNYDDKVTKGEVIKEGDDGLNLVDPDKYIVEQPEEEIRIQPARFSAPEDGLNAIVNEGAFRSISTVSANKPDKDGEDPGNHKVKAGNPAPYIVGAVLAGTVAVGLGVTGAWNMLWLLLLGLLFAKKRKKWHGLLTYENNMFVKVKGDATGVEDMQDIINKGVSIDELRTLMESSDVETILPARTQMTIDVEGMEEQTLEADEDKFYEILSEAKGHAIVTIFNSLGKFSMTVEMDLK